MTCKREDGKDFGHQDLVEDGGNRLLSGLFSFLVGHRKLAEEEIPILQCCADGDYNTEQLQLMEHY